MNKAKLIAYSAIACAVATLCVIGSAYVKWIAVILAVIASVTVCIPILISPKHIVYSILTVVACGVIGAFLTPANIAYTAIIVCIAMPIAIVKSHCDNITLHQEYIQDKRKQTTKKWILYFVVCEIGVAITVGAMYLLTPSLLSTIIDNNILWLAILLANIIVPIYDYLLRGCFAMIMQIMRKAKILP